MLWMKGVKSDTGLSGNNFFSPPPRRGKLTVFTVLCEVYHPSLQRDPAYNMYLDKIGQVFFGVTPPPEPNGPPGMLGE